MSRDLAIYGAFQSVIIRSLPSVILYSCYNLTAHVIVLTIQRVVLCSVHVVS